MCPVCGKSSSLKTFPAGVGDDLMLQTFRGMGRGRGFAVVSRESGIDDPALATALKPKVLGLLGVLVAHGHVTRSEISNSFGDEEETTAEGFSSPTPANASEMESELAAERKTRAILEQEVTELQMGVTRLLRQWREEEQRVAILQRDLDRLREPSARLIEATSEGALTLELLRAELRGICRGRKELNELVQNMQAIVEAAKAVGLAGRPESHERPGAHDAR